VHVHLHAMSQKKHAKPAQDGAAAVKSTGPDRKAVIADSLSSTVRSLRLPATKTEWIDYYGEAGHYSSAAAEFKRQTVERLIRDVQPRLMYDLGGNVGEFSRLATRQGIYTICYDIDPLCVDRNYRESKASGDVHMLPLLTDLSNPSPALGFGLEERDSFLRRSKPGLVLALALIHHLRITANVPLARIAEFFAGLTDRLLIEFVPKSDPMVRTMLSRRPDIFEDYTLESFLEVFGRHFRLDRSIAIPQTDRTLCLFQKLG